MSRQNFVKAARVMFDNALEDQVALGRNSYQLAESRGLRGEAVVAPLGGLVVEDYLPVKQLTDDQLRSRLQRMEQTFGIVASEPKPKGATK